MSHVTQHERERFFGCKSLAKRQLLVAFLCNFVDLFGGQKLDFPNFKKFCWMNFFLFVCLLLVNIVKMFCCCRMSKFEKCFWGTSKLVELHRSILRIFVSNKKHCLEISEAEKC